MYIRDYDLVGVVYLFVIEKYFFGEFLLIDFGKCFNYICFGQYFVIWYVFFVCLYILIVVQCYCVIDKYIGSQYLVWGINIISRNYDWQWVNQVWQCFKKEMMGINRFMDLDKIVVLQIVDFVVQYFKVLGRGIIGKIVFFY